MGTQKHPRRRMRQIYSSRVIPKATASCCSYAEKEYFFIWQEASLSAEAQVSSLSISSANGSKFAPRFA